MTTNQEHDMTDRNYTTAEALGAYSRELAEQGFDEHLIREIVKHAAHVIHNKDDMLTFTVHPPKAETADPLSSDAPHVDCAKTIRALQHLLVETNRHGRCACLKCTYIPARDDR